ncbi:hypothetical protein [Mesorhizobium sp.]|uniref:hypothetical protein n=1 Tax=Mesorhizobium sp. TaxID=1871066 RepID=UPI0025DFA992|nr:hypothetical protein [Mesorhizobium sp.]
MAAPIIIFIIDSSPRCIRGEANWRQPEVLFSQGDEHVLARLSLAMTKLGLS